tara:strand:+ start:417 stop:719 length:303 start_codon:yes stop_codon:yes gene_type:complete
MIKNKIFDAFINVANKEGCDKWYFKDLPVSFEDHCFVEEKDKISIVISIFGHGPDQTEFVTRILQTIPWEMLESINYESVVQFDGRLTLYFDSKGENDNA